MEYRSLGRTGVQVSKLCLGTMMFVERASPQVSRDILNLAFDSGINYVDTANMYSAGHAEEIVGEFLNDRKIRDRVVLSSKFHFPTNRNDPNARGNSRKHIIAACESSLKRLQTDYLDIYHIHRPSSSVPIDETLRALDDLITSGKVLYVGTSTFSSWQIVESIWVARELGLNRVICEQAPYNLLDRRVERELLPAAETYGLAVTAWSPLAGGFLSGQYTSDESRPVGSRHAEVGNKWADRHFVPAAFEVVGALQDCANFRGCTPSQLALAWCCRLGGVTCTVIGPRTVEQLEEALNSVAIELSLEELTRLDHAAPPGKTVLREGYYEADFGPHRWRV